jgi:hypothetical protein
MRIKHGEFGADARVDGIKPEALIIWMVASQVYRDWGFRECVLTEGTGAHDDKPGSLHPDGYAVDLRTRGMSVFVANAIAGEIDNRLGPDYDVFFEGGPAPHIHGEYDPKWKI